MIFKNVLLVSMALGSFHMSFANSAIDPIKTVASQDLTCETSTDCLTLASGAAACGGPSNYVVTSRKNLQLNDLVEMINFETSQQAAYHATSGIAGVCVITARPDVVCSAQKQCVEVSP